MRLESLIVKNYRAFRNVAISNIPQFAVFIGANGTGKTTLFDVFGFLRDALQTNVRQALQKRGGYKEVLSRDTKGPIEIEVKFRTTLNKKERLVTYALSILEENRRPIVTREILKFKRGAHGKPFHFLDYSNGEGYSIQNEEDFDKTEENLHREVQALSSPDLLAIKGLGQFQKFRAAQEFREFIENWHVSDFHIAEARNTPDATVYSEHLDQSGTNLAVYAQYLAESYPELFDTVLKKMQKYVPGISDIQAHPTDEGKILLKFQDGSFSEPFVGRFVSDGTIKMFAYLLLLADPDPHPLMCIEEPENQLYVSLLRPLAEEFRAYAERRGGQVFVSTHSPDFLNALRLHEVFWLKKHGGYTSVERTSGHRQIKSLFEEGDPLGALWKQGFFTGADPE